MSMNIINLALYPPSAFSAVLVLEKRRSAKFQRVWRDGTTVVAYQERFSQKIGREHRMMVFQSRKRSFGCMSKPA